MILIFVDIFSNLQASYTNAISRDYTHFLISNTFISNTRLKLAKNQLNAKLNLEAELLLLEKYSYFSSSLSSKNNGPYSEKK